MSSTSAPEKDPVAPRHIVRTLNGLTDIYMAKYDSDTDSCIPIPEPNCPSPNQQFLALPYMNTQKYAKIFRVLTRIQTDTNPFTIFQEGVKRYVGPDVDLSALVQFYNELNGDAIKHVEQVFRFMATLALELNEENFVCIPLLDASSNKSLTLSQRQAAILVANAFFCTLEDSNKRRRGPYNTFSFLNLFTSKTSKSVEKLRCVFAYFSTIHEKMPTGTITILRNNCPFIRFEDRNPKIIDVKVEEEGFIEEQAGEAHVDFANNFIGGGVLSNGAVQEEIRFITSPETLVSCLLCEQMKKNEAIVIVGAQQYANYTGYRNTFEFAGRRNEQCVKRSKLGHYPSYIIAIDAIRFNYPAKQFFRMAIDREIRKAFIGFAIRLPDDPKTIATGNWGCGAFNGNAELKFLIQVIAASAAGRDLHYFTFGNKKLADTLRSFMCKIRERSITFESLYNSMVKDARSLIEDLSDGSSPLDFTPALTCSSTSLDNKTTIVDQSAYMPALSAQSQPQKPQGYADTYGQPKPSQYKKEEYYYQQADKK